MAGTKKAEKLPIHKMIPNMITLTALAMGMTSIKYAIAERWEAAVTAILIASIMDAFDGAAARLLKAQSKLGAELDSFSDLICFGVAPAIVIYLWALEGTGKWSWPVALIFAIAVALRLSRFNIACDDAEAAANPLTKYFTGVPSPVGALLSFFPLVVSFQLADPTEISRYPHLIGIWMIIVAGMMVSNIPTFSTKQIKIPVRMKVPVLAVFGIILAAMISDTWTTLTVVGAVYLFLMPLGVRHYNRKAASLAAGTRDADDQDDSE